MTPHPAVVVLGPTASGKSDVAMEVARQLGDVSIIAADAMQVYRRMDIGTAKPTRDDQRTVPHYCIDVVEPSERYTVAAFQADGLRALDEIAHAGRRAVIVGGTGLYVTAIVDGLTMPGEWPEIRAELESIDDIAVLVEELRRRDPVALAKIDSNNRRRLVRALEVCRGSGRAFSSFGEGITQYAPSPIRQFGIRWTRDALARRIEARVDKMFDQGLVEEVAGLLNESDPMSATASQALGYKELVDHLEGRCSLDEARSTIVLRTRQFAVRQERWYRRDPRIVWIDVISDVTNEIVPVILEAMA